MSEKDHRKASEDQQVVNDIKQELVDEPEASTDESGTESDAGRAEPEESELEKVRQEKDELYQRLLRVQAEYDNYRKRTQREKEAAAKYKSQSLLEELLPIVDSFERALSAEKDQPETGFTEGMQMVYRQLKTVLEKEGLQEIKAEGEVFDPTIHQAVQQVEDERYESNIVVEELQKGYMLKDRVIRPAMVKVSQ